jgi:hypothetical protein
VKTKLRSIWILALAGGLLTGCASLQSPHVIGDTVYFDESDIGEELVFNFGGVPFSMRLVDRNRFHLARMEWDPQHEVYEVTEGELILSGFGQDVLFLNVREAGEEHYTVMRLSRAIGGEGQDGFKALAFTIDEDVMNYLVREGPIDISSHRGTYVMNATKAEVDAFLRAHLKEAFLYTAGFEIEQVSGDNLLASAF